MEASEQSLAILRQKVELLREQEVAVEQAEEALKAAKEAARYTSEVTIPQIMEMCGIAEIKTGDGLTVSVKNVYQARIAEKNKEAAFQWLEDRGHGHVVRNDVSVSFSAGDSEGAGQAVDALNAMGLDVSSKRSVHPSTLKALVKEQLEGGVHMPHDLFGIYECRRTVIK
jgi:hypothetical protein